MMNNEDNPKFWENIYKNDDAGWDLGGPTPVFVNISSIIKNGIKLIAPNIEINVNLCRSGKLVFQ